MNKQVIISIGREYGSGGHCTLVNDVIPDSKTKKKRHVI